MSVSDCPESSGLCVNSECGCETCRATAPIAAMMEATTEGRNLRGSETLVASNPPADTSSVGGPSPRGTAEEVIFSTGAATVARLTRSESLGMVTSPPHHPWMATSRHRLTSATTINLPHRRHRTLHHEMPDAAPISIAHDACLLDISRRLRLL